MRGPMRPGPGPVDSAATRWLKQAMSWLTATAREDEEKWLLTGRAARRATGQRTPQPGRANIWSRSHKAHPASFHTHVAVRLPDGSLARVPVTR